MVIDSGMREKIKIVYHPDYAVPYSTASCETPERVTSIIKELDNNFSIIEPAPCMEDDILLCHSEGLLNIEKYDSIRYNVARLAVGGAILASELALEGNIAFGLLRPPGHHANPDHNWGFCFFNNMAIAISKLLKSGKIVKAVILDIDLHFGDGTDTIFENNNNVYVINIQSSNPFDFINETERSLKDIDHADIIGISAGFDQYEKDWGGNLSTSDYYRIGQIAGLFSKEKTEGKIFGILEGGYYIPDLGINLIALLKGICDCYTS